MDELHCCEDRVASESTKAAAFCELSRLFAVSSDERAFPATGIGVKRRAQTSAKQKRGAIFLQMARRWSSCRLMRVNGRGGMKVVDLGSSKSLYSQTVRTRIA